MKRWFSFLLIFSIILLSMYGISPAKAADKKIVAVSAEDVSITEYLNGYYDENGTFIYDLTSSSYTITYDDGSSESGDWGYFFDQYININSEDPQQSGGSLSIGPNTIVLSVNTIDPDTWEQVDTGVRGSYTVTLNEIPYDSITIEDVQLVENIDGSSYADYDEYGNPGNEYFHYYISSPIYVLTMKDGSDPVRGSSDDIFNVTGVYPYCELPQSESNQCVAGQTYQAVVSLGGIRGFGNVTIVDPLSVTAVSVSELTLYEETNGTFDADGHFIYNIEPENLYVTFADGHSEEGDSQYFNNMGISFVIEDPQTSGTIFTEGTSYNIVLHVYKDGVDTGVSGSFSVTVEEMPYASIVAEPVTLTETINARPAYDENGNAYPYYALETNLLNYTITYKDGRTANYTGQDVIYSLGEEPITPQYPQDPANILAPGNYQFPFTFCGLAGSVDVTIVPCPYSGITIEDVTLMQNAYGHMETEFDADGNETEYFHYDLYQCPDIVYILTLNDGSEVRGTNSEIYELTNATPGVEAVQSASSPCLPGNTYPVDVSLGMLTGTGSMTISDSTVASIQVDDVTYRQFADGWMDRYIDADGTEKKSWRYPDGFSSAQITVTMKDGTVVKGSEYDLEQRLGGNMIFDEFQSPGQELPLGQYPINVSYLGASATFTVNIVPSPVKSIYVPNYSLIQYFDANPVSKYNAETNTETVLKNEDGGMVCLYPIWPDLIEVTLTDGSVIKGKFDDIIWSLGGSPEITSDQYSANGEYNEWQPGEHTCKIWYMGQETTFTVTLEATAVAHSFTRHILTDEYVYCPATCMTPGLYFCGCEYHEGEISNVNYYPNGALGENTDPNNHYWSEWEVVKKPSATEAGLKRRVCTAASHAEPVVEEVVIPAGTAPEDYLIIEGADTTWGKMEGSEDVNNTASVTIVSDAPIEKYIQILVNGKPLDEGYIESIISGSTRVTLPARYLRALQTGVHTVTIVSTDGECTTDLTITTRETELPTEDDNSSKPEDESSSKTEESSESSQATESSQPSSESSSGEESSQSQESTAGGESSSSQESSKESTEASSGSETSSTETSSSPADETSSNSSTSGNNSQAGGTQDSTSGKPVTGDHTNAVGYAVLLMSALVLMILVLEKRHEKA